MNNVFGRKGKWGSEVLLLFWSRGRRDGQMDVTHLSGGVVSLVAGLGGSGTISLGFWSFCFVRHFPPSFIFSWVNCFCPALHAFCRERNADDMDGNDAGGMANYELYGMRYMGDGFMGG